MTLLQAATSVAAHFATDGELMTVERYGVGYINDSFLLTNRGSHSRSRVLLQRINQSVFQNPIEVMDNIRRVTAHIAMRLEQARVADADRRVLSLVPTTRGQPWHRDAAGSIWRMYHFIEGVMTKQLAHAPREAEAAARAFGRFQNWLTDLPPPPLHDTIPRFHNTSTRFEALHRAVQTDAHNRAATATVEIAFALRHKPIANRLLDLKQTGRIRKRIVHNDAKLGNVLLDRTTGEGLCVVDLDTVMPGLVLYDFGDMVRSMATTANEDEIDLNKVAVHMSLFEALARGYLSEAGAFLTPVERGHLALAGKLITLEQGVRFLTDFLNGDVYYKTTQWDQNLHRCRNQFRLFESISGLEERMQRYIDGL